MCADRSVITDDQIRAMNSDMAAMWIVGSGGHLSKPQWHALLIACRNGGYVQAGTAEYNGRVEQVSASALRALVRRGYLTHCYDTEGGVAGRLSLHAREQLANVVKAQDHHQGDLPVTIATPASAAPASDETASARGKREERERAMFGCTAAAIDEALHGMEPRDIARYAMGTLSNAQELIRHDTISDDGLWTVKEHDANTIRQLINVAKYAIDKAVPR